MFALVVIIGTIIASLITLYCGYVELTFIIILFGSIVSLIFEDAGL